MIAVDRRVGSAHLHPLLPPGLAQLATLPYGDVCWYGVGPGGARVGVGVECKRVNDLLQCLHTGRFVGDQLPGMLAVYQYTYLLVEGMTRPGADGALEEWKPWANGRGGEWRMVKAGARGCEWAVWEGHLETLRRKTPLRVVYSTGPQHTAELILTLYKWWAHGGGWDAHTSHTGVHIPPEPSVGGVPRPAYRRLVLRFAQQLPGVREVLAERVAGAFDTVRDMVRAGVEEWEKVEGIGAAKAVAIVSAIHGPMAHQPAALPQPQTTSTGTLFPQLGELRPLQNKTKQEKGR